MGSWLEILRESLEAEGLRLLAAAPRIAAALVVLAVSIWIGAILGRGVAVLLERGGLTPTHKVFFRRLTRWLVGLVGLAVALNLLGLSGAAAGLLAGGGITAIVLGFAFRQIGENFLAGFFLAFSRPFNVGDLIQSGELEGVVRKIELRSTHIRTADARDIFIPNSRIFNEPLVNFTRDGLRRPAFRVGIDYADDAEAACRLLEEAAAGVAGVLAEPRPAAALATLAPLYVEIEVAFWIDAFGLPEGRGLPRVRSEVMNACRAALHAGGFTLSSEVTSSVSVSGRLGDGPPGGGGASG